jgi:hypothetical protein
VKSFDKFAAHPFQPQKILRQENIGGTHVRGNSRCRAGISTTAQRSRGLKLAAQMHAADGEFGMVRFNVQYPSPFCENVKPGDANCPAERPGCGLPGTRARRPRECYSAHCL